MFGKGKRNDNCFTFLYASIHARIRWLEDTAAVIGRIGLRRYPSHRDVDIEEDLDTRKTSCLQDQGKDLARLRSKDKTVLTLSESTRHRDLDR